MPNTFSELDAAAKRLSFYRLEPNLPLPDETSVRSSAATVGFNNLPDDVVDFYCRFGAGAFDRPALLPLPAACPLGEVFWVDILYAIGAGRDWSPTELFQSTYAERLPEYFLPIGTDPGGSLLILGVEDRKGIYVWDHEHRELLVGEFDQRVAELQAKGVDTHNLDVDKILLLWDLEFLSRVKNPSGHGNLYPVADSFAQACTLLQEQ